VKYVKNIFPLAPTCPEQAKDFSTLSTFNSFNQIPHPIFYLNIFYLKTTKRTHFFTFNFFT